MDRWLVETSLGGSRILCLEALESCPRSSSGSNTNITRETCSTKCTLHQVLLSANGVDHLNWKYCKTRHVGIDPRFMNDLLLSHACLVPINLSIVQGNRK